MKSSDKVGKDNPGENYELADHKEIANDLEKVETTRKAINLGNSAFGSFHLI